MNSRGLMELIVLNIGYDMGLLNPELFTMLVLMALITTLFTGPGLNLIAVFQPKKEKEIHIEKAYKVLLSFANPKMGGALLDLTRQLIIRTAPDTLFTALHISPRTDLSPDDARIFERESFIPIRAVAEKNNLTLSTIYVNTHEIHSEIIQTCRHEKPDFLILGSARSVFSTDILGGILRKILNESPCDTLIFNERSFKRIRSVLLISYGNGDDYLFDYARLLNHAGGVKFHACNMGSGLTESGPVFEDAGIPLNTVSDSLLQTEFLHTIDLVLIADMNWRTLEGEQHVPLGQFPSLLIIHKGSNENRILG
jgi:hypothetical protein